MARHSAEAPLALNALHLAGDFMTAMRALQDEIAESGPREDGYSVPYATVHVGKLTGGTVVNFVPDRAELLMEIRVLAADDADALATRLHETAEAIVSAFSRRLPASGPDGVARPEAIPDLPRTAAMPPCAPSPPAFRRQHRRCRLSYGTEGGLFAQRLGVPVVVCGPGDMAQGHRPDEFIAASQLAACDAMLDAGLERFCVSPAQDNPP